jgi:AraC-like DNA-binding protein
LQEFNTTLNIFLQILRKNVRYEGIFTCHFDKRSLEKSLNKKMWQEYGDSSLALGNDRLFIPLLEKNIELLAAFNSFKNHLEKHFAKTRNAKEYAEMIGISYNRLNAACKSIAGNTAKAFIDKFIILETKRRLATSDISVKELTYAMGFDEPTNFLKYFKKQTGQSPLQFKKKLTK